MFKENFESKKKFAIYEPNYKRKASRELSEEHAPIKVSPNNQLSLVLGELNQTLSKYLNQKVSPVQSTKQQEQPMPSTYFNG